MLLCNGHDWLFSQEHTPRQPPSVIVVMPTSFSEMNTENWKQSSTPLIKDLVVDLRNFRMVRTVRIVKMKAVYTFQRAGGYLALNL